MAWFILPECATERPHLLQTLASSLLAWSEVLVSKDDETSRQCRKSTCERKLPLPAWLPKMGAHVMVNIRLHFLKFIVRTKTANCGSAWKNLVCLLPPSLSQRWQDKVPWTEWLNRVDVHSFTILETASLKSSGQVCRTSLQYLERILPWLVCCPLCSWTCDNMAWTSTLIISSYFCVFS